MDIETSIVQRAMSAQTSAVRLRFPPTYGSRLEAILRTRGSISVPPGRTKDLEILDTATKIVDGLACTLVDDDQIQDIVFDVRWVALPSPIEVVERAPTVSVDEISDRLRLRPDFDDARWQLWRAEATFNNLRDERRFPGMIHEAVGALEEVARHQTTGAGHGAGRAPKEVARFTRHRVMLGLRALLVAFGIGD